MRRLPLLGFVTLGFALNSAQAAPSTSSTPAITLADLVAEALAAHPSVQTAQLRAEAMTQRVEPAGAWMDPMVSLGINNLPYAPPSFNATPMTGVRLAVQQSFPWPGKTGEAKAAMLAGTRALESSVQGARNELAAAVRSTYYDIHFLDVSRMVLQENLRIIERFIEAAHAKYRVGRGLQQDVLRARVARSRLEERIIAVKRERATMLTRLRNLLARTTPLHVPPLLEVAMSDLLPESTAEALTARAETAEPRIARLRHLIAQADAKARLADLAALPDLTVGLSYTFRGDAGGRDPANGADFLGLTVGAPIPIFHGSKQGPLAEAARRDAVAMSRELDEVRLRIKDTVEQGLGQLAELRAQMKVYEDQIIPSTRQILEADLIAYQVDKVDVFDLLDVEMKLINYQIDLHRLHVQHEKILVGLAQTVGVEPAVLGRPGAHVHVHGVKP